MGAYALAEGCYLRGRQVNLWGAFRGLRLVWGLGFRV